MLSEFYTTVDECPLIVWCKCNEGLFYWIKKDKSKEKESVYLEKWEMLYNDFIKVVGLNEQFEQLLSLKLRIIGERIKFIESKKNGFRDRFILNKIQMLQHEMTQIEKATGTGISMTGALLNMSKMQGYHVNVNVITVKEYFELIKIYNGGSKN
jgi:hypothetical protein